MAREVDEATFDDAVLKNPKAVLVDFYATWCGPCVAQAPVLEKWAGANQAVVEVVKLNVDNAPTLAAKYGVMSIPTLVVFNGGQERSRAIGSQNEKGLDGLIAKSGVKKTT